MKAIALPSGMESSAVESASYTLYPPQYPGMGRISAMARATGATIYAVEYDSANLYRIEASTKSVTLEAALPYANPSDLEYSAAEDRLFISYRYKGVISTYSLAGQRLFTSYRPAPRTTRASSSSTAPRGR